MAIESFLIRSRRDAERAARAVAVQSPGTMIVIRSPNKKESQRALFHAMLSELARRVFYKGRRYTIDEWKDAFVGSLWGWKERTCPITGRVSAVRRSTEDLTVPEYWELIDYTRAEAETALNYRWLAYRPGDPLLEVQKARGK